MTIIGKKDKIYIMMMMMMKTSIIDILNRSFPIDYDVVVLVVVVFVNDFFLLPQQQLEQKQNIVFGLRFLVY